MHGIVPIGNHPIFRWLFGWSLPPKYSLLKYVRLNVVPQEALKTFFCQDFVVNIKTIKKSIEFFHENLKIYPIWICPTVLKLDEDSKPHYANIGFDEDKMFIDVGLYG